jgi:hypothetical protein
LTDVKYNLVLEAYNIPLEHLYADDLLQKICNYWSKKQAGSPNGSLYIHITRWGYLSSGDLVTQGGDEMKEAKEEIKT